MLRKKAINIGELDRKVTIRTQSATVNSQFGQTLAFTDAATVWARVEYQSRSQQEDMYGGQDVSFQQIAFLIRYPVGYSVSVADRVYYDGDEFDIIAINKDIGRNQFWELITELRQ